MKPLDLQGQKFGKLRVVARAAHQPDGAVWWHCICECGAAKDVRGSDLKRGFVLSCGCWRREMPKCRSTHGGSSTRLYRIWQAMHDRTSNPKASRYAYYGGRGISVCEEWTEFDPFQAWSLSNGYADDLSIDRIDNNGNYEPSNCRWATQAVQVRNRRSRSEIQQGDYKMKTFKLCAAQGEITIRRMGDVPADKSVRAGCTAAAVEGGKFIIGHSETGHNHVLSRTDGCHVMVLDRPPEGMRILYAILESPTSLDHQRDHDTHESIMLPPGEYEFRLAREYDPYAELARQSMD